MMIREVLHSAVPFVFLALCVAVLPSCAARRGTLPADFWTGADSVSYRALSKADFKSKVSNSLWGNFAHGAEICTNILPAENYEETGHFHAVMNQECSFWNHTIGPLGFLTRMVGMWFGVPTVTPVKQPDWYILQHEQIHFAIMQVAALQLSNQITNLPSSRRTPQLTRRIHQITLQHTSDRHYEFDSETSGTYDPDNLEKWVSVLEMQMTELCGTEEHCKVRLWAKK